MDYQLTTEVWIRFLINCISILLLVFVANPNGKRWTSTNQTFFLFGVAVYLVTALLHQVEMTMGFAFGLFAVFAMLRYRTETLSVQNLTFLFMVIAIALMSAVSQVSLIELIVVNMVLCLIVWISLKFVKRNNLDELTILYDDIENISQDKVDILMSQLSDKLGRPVQKVELIDVDFLREIAKIKVLFREDESPKV